MIVGAAGDGKIAAAATPKVSLPRLRRAVNGDVAVWIIFLGESPLTMLTTVLPMTTTGVLITLLNTSPMNPKRPIYLGVGPTILSFRHLAKSNCPTLPCV